MADAFTLASTLPPFLYQGNQSMVLTPVISATYEPADFEKKVNTQGHLFNLEAINRAVMSGKNVDANVDSYKKKIAEYHSNNIAKMPTIESVPVLGMASMKTITMKHLKNAME